MDADLLCIKLEKISVMNFKDITLIVYIEECNMMAVDPLRFEKAWKAIHENSSNIYAFFSTSRPSLDVFIVSNKRHNRYEDIICSIFCTRQHYRVRKSMVEKFREPGEKVLVYHGHEILSDPFPDNS